MISSADNRLSVVQKEFTALMKMDAWEEGPISEVEYSGPNLRFEDMRYTDESIKMENLTAYQGGPI